MKQILQSLKARKTEASKCRFQSKKSLCLTEFRLIYKVADAGVIHIDGARPNFIKIASIIRAFQSRKANSSRNLNYRLVYTGQHYDQNMSAAFFIQLGIPEPEVNSEVGSNTHARQTSAMTAYENLLLDKPCDLKPGGR